jgi:surface antigen
MLIAFGTLASVVPAGGETSQHVTLVQSLFNWVASGNNNPNLIQQQAATATAVNQLDGYESNQGNTGSPSYSSSGGPNRFAYGNCTYWANMRYHQLTGNWVPWSGNAGAWAFGATASGWVVSQTPRVPSIIVLQPGVQGAGWFGHVAIVERINPDGSVWTSNYNWYAGGGWNILSYYTFHTGPGVSFVWRP